MKLNAHSYRLAMAAAVALGFVMGLAPASARAQAKARIAAEKRMAQAVDGVWTAIDTMVDQFLGGTPEYRRSVFYKLLVRGKILVQAGDYDTALEVLARAALNTEFESEPAFPDALIAYAEVLLRSGHAGSARYYAEIAVNNKMSPGYADQALAVWFSAALQTHATADIAKYEPRVQQFLARAKPDDSYAHTLRYEYAKYLLLNGKLDDAVKNLSVIPWDAPIYPQARYILGSALVARKNFPDAIKVFESISDPNTYGYPPPEEGGSAAPSRAEDAEDESAAAEESAPAEGAEPGTTEGGEAETAASASEGGEETGSAPAPSRIDPRDRATAELANMALGRLLYEREEFISAYRAFSVIAKDSPFYVDAVEEIFWLFVRAGHKETWMETKRAYYARAREMLDEFIRIAPPGRLDPRMYVWPAKLMQLSEEWTEADAAYVKQAEEFVNLESLFPPDRAGASLMEMFRKVEQDGKAAFTAFPRVYQTLPGALEITDAAMIAHGFKELTAELDAAQKQLDDINGYLDGSDKRALGYIREGKLLGKRVREGLEKTQAEFTKLVKRVPNYRPGGRPTSGEPGPGGDADVPAEDATPAKGGAAAGPKELQRLQELETDLREATTALDAYMSGLDERRERIITRTEAALQTERPFLESQRQAADAARQELERLAADIRDYGAQNIRPRLADLFMYAQRGRADSAYIKKVVLSDQIAAMAEERGAFRKDQSFVYKDLFFGAPTPEEAQPPPKAEEAEKKLPLPEIKGVEMDAKALEMKPDAPKPPEPAKPAAKPTGKKGK